MSLSVYQVVKNSFSAIWPRKVSRFFRYAHQRCTKGFCEGDTYEMCNWFTQIFPEMLDYLTEHNISYPHRLDEEWVELHWDELNLSRDCEKLSPNSTWFFMNLCSDDPKREKQRLEMRDYSSKRWNEILSEMASCFRFCAEDPHEHFKNAEFKGPDEEDRAYAEFCERQIAAKNKAFALMSEWFFDLWR